MMNSIQSAITFLLKNANPSIKRRVKSEILNNLTTQEAAEDQEQIMAEPVIQRIIASQKENGWIGDTFHGGLDTQEGGTKYLAEKALNKDTPVLKQSMEAFKNIPLDSRCYGTRGKIIDEMNP